MLVFQITRLTKQLETQREKVVEMEGRMATLEAETAGLAGDKLELEVCTKVVVIHIFNSVFTNN